MSKYNIKWLQSFLNLGARSKNEAIPIEDIERQENTVIQAMNMLDKSPGVVLADEVGMGKTYEAIGVIACTLHKNKNAKIAVITPGPDLGEKWKKEFAGFKESDIHNKLFPRNSVYKVDRLSEFVEKIKKHNITIAPVSMFQSGRGHKNTNHILSLFCHWKKLGTATRNKIMESMNCEHTSIKNIKFLEQFYFNELAPYLEEAFCTNNKDHTKVKGLNDLYEKHKSKCFNINNEEVKSALYKARFVLAGRLIPKVDLLIVDEAHKLKNPSSLRSFAMQVMFHKKFKKALFLTATPFQLDISELRQVFGLFTGATSAPSNLDSKYDNLLQKIKEYRQEYSDFQNAWSDLDNQMAMDFRRKYNNNEPDGFSDPTYRTIAKHIKNLKSMKNKEIEPRLRDWMIRSIRKERIEYRKTIPQIIKAAKNETFIEEETLIFLIYERLIAELFRHRRRTHKAAVEINMVSSYIAAHKGAIMQDTYEDIPIGEIRIYRNLLKDILTKIVKGNYAKHTIHPKVHHVLENALGAVEKNEKTLIFCTRKATLEQLKNKIEQAWDKRLIKNWQKAYPNATEEYIFGSKANKNDIGRHKQLQNRFHKPQDALYMALREPYLATVVPIAKQARQKLTHVVNEANRIMQNITVHEAYAEKFNYKIAKRCIEQAAVVICGDAAKKYSKHYCIIEDHRFINYGFDLKADKYEQDKKGSRKPKWKITERSAEIILKLDGTLWKEPSALLNGLDNNMRVRVVEQLSRYMTYKEVTFVSDLLIEAAKAKLPINNAISSATIIEFMPTFWKTDTGGNWRIKINQFLEYFCQRFLEVQDTILNEAIKTGQLVRHTQDTESREKLREAFNTPLYPMILVANEVMQEGLDLHKNCRRIVHHDLLWNPAEIEQRIGRIDRIGSLTSNLRSKYNTTTLDIIYPLIQDTIDIRLYKTVKDREKWLEFILGAKPDFGKYDLSEKEPEPLPDNLAEELTINLAPNKAS